jgi:hypothetical protein
VNRLGRYGKRCIESVFDVCVGTNDAGRKMRRPGHSLHYEDLTENNLFKVDRLALHYPPSFELWE